MRRGTTPEPPRLLERLVELVPRGARARAGAGGALDFSSACSSRLQIGQLAVRRLWRQKRDTGAVLVVAARARWSRRRAGRAPPNPRARAPPPRARAPVGAA